MSKYSTLLYWFWEVEYTFGSSEGVVRLESKWLSLLKGSIALVVGAQKKLRFHAYDFSYLARTVPILLVNYSVKL